jgi:hypothetical protein
MGRKFWKATLVSLVIYAGATLVGFLAGFQYTLFLVPVLYVSWTLFCVVRIIQLRRNGGHKPDATECDRESYAFALGGSISSTALLLAVVVLTQIF